MPEILVHTITVAVITFLANLLFYRLAPGKDAEAREQGRRLYELQDRVDDLESKEIAELRGSLVTAARNRKEIYQHMRDELVSNRACTGIQAQTQHAIRTTGKRLEGLAVQVGDVAAQTAETSGIVKLIANHMNLTMGRSSDT